MSKKFVSWRRVSTQKQNRSGLGLEAQADIIKYFVQAERGELVADFCECYTGTELSGCVELKKAMEFCKKNDAVLVIAKTDRFRNTIEALEVYEEMGDGNILFCDLPHTDKFTLTLFFALAEREALLVSIRTKAALAAKKARGESSGGSNGEWGKHTGAKREEVITAASNASAKSRRKKAEENPENKAFRDFIEDWQAIHGRIVWQTDWQAISDKLNDRGRRTSTGLSFTPKRARAMYGKIQELYNLR